MGSRRSPSTLVIGQRWRGPRPLGARLKACSQPRQLVLLAFGGILMLQVVHGGERRAGVRPALVVCEATGPRVRESAAATREGLYATTGQSNVPAANVPPVVYAGVQVQRVRPRSDCLYIVFFRQSYSLSLRTANLVNSPTGRPCLDPIGPESLDPTKD